jgi:hypothetical protein
MPDSTVPGIPHTTANGTEAAPVPSPRHLSHSGAVQGGWFQRLQAFEVPYRVLSDLLGEASGKGILRALRQKYSATAFEAMLFPLLREVDRQKPVPPRRHSAPWGDGADPLTTGPG